jgi:hypothetical protein
LDTRKPPARLVSPPSPFFVAMLLLMVSVLVYIYAQTDLLRIGFGVFPNG